jgi:hypothetical protein
MFTFLNFGFFLLLLSLVGFPANEAMAREFKEVISLQTNATSFTNNLLISDKTASFKKDEDSLEFDEEFEEEEELEEEEEEVDADSTEEEEEELEDEDADSTEEDEEEEFEEEVDEVEIDSSKSVDIDDTEADEDEEELEDEDEEFEDVTPTVTKPKIEPKDTDFFDDSEEESTNETSDDEEEDVEESTTEEYFTVAPKFKQRKNLGEIESSTINEASGIVASRISEGVLWTHNDSGGEPEIYAISNEGYILATFRINGIQHPASKNSNIINRDWEDIAIGPGPKDETDYLYVGEIGDNNAIYGTYFIYRVEEPFVEVDQDSSHITNNNVETIAYKYEDGARDAETMFVDPNSGDIYIVSKREDSVGVYLLEYPHSTTEVMTARKVATLPFSSAVAGDISPEGDEIIIKNYVQIFYWSVVEDESIASALQRQPVILPYTPEPQGEGLCWDPENLGYYTISEEPIPNLQSALYFYERIEDEVTSVDEENDDDGYSSKYDSYIEPKDDSDYMRYLAFSEGSNRVLDEKMRKILNGDFHLQVLHLGLNRYSISTYMKTSMFISLDVYDANGRLIHEVYYGKVHPGPTNFIFDATSLIAGTYFVQIRTNGGAWTEKILVW